MQRQWWRFASTGPEVNSQNTVDVEEHDPSQDWLRETQVHSQRCRFRYGNVKVTEVWVLEAKVSFSVQVYEEVVMRGALLLNKNVYNIRRFSTLNYISRITLYKNADCPDNHVRLAALD